ncbi:MAG: primase-helicase family protein [Pseudomonadota bacterium]
MTAGTAADLRSFLETLFGAAAPDVWVAGFQDIERNPQWGGVRGLDALVSRIGGEDNLDKCDLFFCIGILDPGAQRRANENVVSQPLLIADDVGSKASEADWERLFVQGCPEPTYRINTSPGNYTYVWALNGTDPRSPEHWADLHMIRAWMVEKNLTDNVMDPARYVRMPGGVNSKAKYGDTPVPVACSGGSGVGATLEALGRWVVGYGDTTWRDKGLPASAQKIPAASGHGALERTADLSNPEPIIRLAELIGLRPRQIRPGVVEADCPNMHLHTSRAETGFAFLGNGMCECFHASCQGLKSSDFVDLMVERYNELRAKYKAGRSMGLIPVDENWENTPGSARDYLARLEFEYSGGRDAGGGDKETQDTMSSLAGQAKKRAEQKDLDVSGLVERFVHVNSAEGYYDRVRREMLGYGQLDKHPVVTPLFKPGLSGTKRASNVLLRHPGLQSADGRGYLPGADEALVAGLDYLGRDSLVVNEWMRPEVGRRAEPPRIWLDLVEHIIPDKTYREFFLNWLAWKVQNPAARTPVIATIASGQGTGKDTMLLPIMAILGQRNVRQVSMQNLEGSFNEWLMSELIVLPELKLSPDGKLYNRIKDLTGQAGWMEINQKYQRPFYVKPSASFVAFTNHIEAIRGMEGDDRRFAVYVSPAAAQDPVKFVSVRGMLSGEGDMSEIERVKDFLLARDLSAFHPYSLPEDVSGSRAAALRGSMPLVTEWVYNECVDAGGLFADREMLSLREVQDVVIAEAPAEVRSAVTRNPAAAQRLVVEGLRAAGCSSTGERARKRENGTQVSLSLWFGPALDRGKKADLQRFGRDAVVDYYEAELNARQDAGQASDKTQTAGPPKLPF